MKRRWVLLTSTALAIGLVVSLVFAFLPPGVSVTGEGLLCLETRIVLAAQAGGTMGDGTPIPQEIVNPILRRGGPPVVSVSYDNQDIAILCSDGISPWVFSGSAGASLANLLATKSIAEVEALANELLQRHFEIWIDIKTLPPADPVRQKPPVLLSNERIVSVGNTDYLVVSLCYGAVHIFSVSPLSYTTRINGVDAGPVTGEWWNE